MNIQLRSAEASDAQALTDLAYAAKRHWGYAEELIELWSGDLTITSSIVKLRKMIVATNDEKIVGMISLDTNDNQAEIDHLWVLPSHMGQGIGAILLKRLLQEAYDDGFKMIEVVSDPNAVGFYQRFGAKQTGWLDSKPKGRRLPVLTIETTPQKIEPVEPAR